MGRRFVVEPVRDRKRREAAENDDCGFPARDFVAGQRDWRVWFADCLRVEEKDEERGCASDAIRLDRFKGDIAAPQAQRQTESDGGVLRGDAIGV